MDQHKTSEARSAERVLTSTRQNLLQVQRILVSTSGHCSTEHTSDHYHYVLLIMNSTIANSVYQELQHEPTCIFNLYQAKSDCGNCIQKEILVPFNNFLSIQRERLFFRLVKLFNDIYILQLLSKICGKSNKITTPDIQR